MSRDLVWTAKALADLEAIGDYIAADSPRDAARWVDKLITAAEASTVAPFAGRRVPELQRDDIRERLIGNYRIVYRVNPVACTLLTIFEGHRIFPDDADPDAGPATGAADADPPE